ncbi:Uncharacterised protein [Gallibacterium anatis]|uniref:Uncharacterized protein n=1 Tax=Gallibacterium anatis TaxID=750 RepID=A0A377H4L8_9PAST|nr:Uncharacterised protein [Gallibacterium anatis]STO61185.1 Uncharacterised protein [Gallibacterium anatis]
MRLPNGYGSVFKLSGKRRKPFIARKTIGYDEIDILPTLKDEDSYQLPRFLRGLLSVGSCC